jgi:hypothetical protein
VQTGIGYSSRILQSKNLSLHLDGNEDLQYLNYPFIYLFGNVDFIFYADKLRLYPLSIWGIRFTEGISPTICCNLAWSLYRIPIFSLFGNFLITPHLRGCLEFTLRLGQGTFSSCPSKTKPKKPGSLSPGQNFSYLNCERFSR